MAAFASRYAKAFADVVAEFHLGAPEVDKQLTDFLASWDESAELREVLDAGEKNLRTLVTQLEQAVNVYGVKPAPDKKSPQPAKVEAITGTDEGSSRIMTRFP